LVIANIAHSPGYLPIEEVNEIFFEEMMVRSEQECSSCRARQTGHSQERHAQVLIQRRHKFEHSKEDISRRYPVVLTLEIRQTRHFRGYD